MQIDEQIALRPRFQQELPISKKDFTNHFTKEALKSDYLISTVDDHIFIRIPVSRSQFWTPELHLEIVEEKDGKILLKGLFGPKPSIWTMFIFFHFAIAGLFIASSIWAYTRYSLETSYTLPLVIIILMILLWVILYVIGRMGRNIGENQMQELKIFLDSVIDSK